MATQDLQTGLTSLAVNVHASMREAMLQAMEREGQRLRSRVMARLEQNGQVATSNLRNSVSVTVAGAASGFNRGTGNEFYEVRVGPSMRYAAAVEFGSRPHWVPLDALLEWVRLKRISGSYAKPKKRGGRGRRLGGKERKFREDLVVASAIQRKIGFHGTRPHPFLEPTYRAEYLGIVARVNTAIAAAAKKASRASRGSA